MALNLREGSQIYGGASRFDVGNFLRGDEFLRKLRGLESTRTYREMRDNNAIIGGVLNAFELLIRSTAFRLDPADDTPEAEEAVELMQGMMDDMEHTWDEFLTQGVSHLAFGFAIFEKVLKTRQGPTNNLFTQSKFTDGYIGYRKLAPRAQWTVHSWFIDEFGEMLGVRQNISGTVSSFLATGYRASPGGFVAIPANKLVHFRTATPNNDPSGRSILRNAYVSYWYATNIDRIEAIGIERELNGLPVARVPSEYLSDAATDEQKRFVQRLERMLRDVKLNAEGYAVIPSEVYEDADGKPSSVRKVEFELMSSNGTRAINTTDVVMRHQKNIAQSMLADFILLGQDGVGSLALSQDKSSLFLKAAQSVANGMAETITEQVIAPIWEINGFDMDKMPQAAFDDISPPNLGEIGEYVRTLSGAGMPMFPDPALENALRRAGDFPERDPEMDDEMLDDMRGIRPHDRDPTILNPDKPDDDDKDDE